MRDAEDNRLRLYGVYVLPNGTEHVVGVGRGRCYFLYNPSAWKKAASTLSVSVELEVDRDGHIFTGAGQVTGWRIEDLIDTRRTIKKEN
ncbi:MAG TPA: hypothetical protein VGX92_14740 [Pyrinomonadaceae bacterium]|nr:hypothetical protein [Pyrinomonadaceae bacterium]